MGNSIRFGDLTVNRYTLGAGASSTRGLFTGGYQDGHSPDTDVNAIEFITIATFGNATDFGDLAVARYQPGEGASATRGVVAGGVASPTRTNTIDFITIATTGNASDFGDATSAQWSTSGFSDAHGGLAQ